MECSGPAIPFGLWELDANGTVRHYEPEIGDHGFQPREVMGRNFFEIMPEQIRELRDQVEGFVHGTTSADSFDLTLQSDEGGIRTRILLARTYRGSTSSPAQLILLHIRRAQT